MPPNKHSFKGGPYTSCMNSRDTQHSWPRGTWGCQGMEAHSPCTKKQLYSHHRHSKSPLEQKRAPSRAQAALPSSVSLPNRAGNPPKISCKSTQEPGAANWKLRFHCPTELPRAPPRARRENPQSSAASGKLQLPIPSITEPWTREPQNQHGKGTGTRGGTGTQRVFVSPRAGGHRHPEVTQEPRAGGHRHPEGLRQIPTCHSQSKPGAPSRFLSTPWVLRGE